MLKQIKLVQFFGGIIVAFWIAFVTLAGFAWSGLNQSANSLHMVHEELMDKTNKLSELSLLITKNRMEVLLMFQHDPNGALRSAHDHALSLHLNQHQERQQTIDKLWSDLKASLKSEQELDLAKTIEDARRRWQAPSDQAIQAIRAEQFTPEIMAAYLKAGREDGEHLLKTLRDLHQKEHEAAEQAAKDADQRHHSAMWAFLALAIGMGVPASVVALYILGRMKNGFSQADATTKAIAAGDLSQTVTADGNDEIAQLLGHIEVMRLNLIDVIAEVRRTADSIQTASAEVAAGNTDLSQRTEQTASNLQQTASSTDELAVTVSQNADNARQANQLAQTASNVATRGGSAVAQVVDTMKGINESSKRIADIIGVIDGIAFQTNILALNAAVEAARAGDQGRGFAVVAGEVRSLAQRSAAAAREIKELIGASVERVEDGTRQADEAGSTMEEVVQSISQVSSIVAEISQASAEQSEGVALVGRAVNQMDSATQQNAALVEQSAAAAESLRHQAEQLVASVARFRL